MVYGRPSHNALGCYLKKGNILVREWVSVYLSLKQSLQLRLDGSMPSSALSTRSLTTEYQIREEEIHNIHTSMKCV